MSPHERIEFADFICNRYEQLEGDLLTFRSKRKVYLQRAEGNNSERLSPVHSDKDKTIWDYSNEEFAIIKSVHRFMRARAHEDFFGTSPYVHAKPEGPVDEVLAEKIQKHFPFKLREADYVQEMKQAFDRALALGEAFVKVAYCTEIDKREELQEIWIDGEGNPVLTPEGEYTFASDAIIETEVLGEGEPIAQVELETLPGVPIGNDWKIEARLIELNEVLREGLDFTLLDHEDVVFPLNCRDLQKADFVAHRMDARLSYLIEKYERYADNEEDARMWEELRMRGRTENSAQNAAKTEHDEQEVTDDWVQNPYVETIEVFAHYCPEPGAPMRRVFAVIDYQSHDVIYAEYLGSIVPGAVAPIFVLPVNRIPGRCYGVGYYELYEAAQRVVDKKLNLIIHHNDSNSDPIRIFNAEKTKQGVENPDLKVGPGQLLNPTVANTPMEDILRIIEMPDLDSRTWQILELFIQYIQNDSGVTAAAQGDAGALPSTQTATGINAILSSGSILHSFTISGLRDAAERMLATAAAMLYKYQNADETFYYMEGESAGLLSLKQAQELQRFRFNITLLLTRMRQREQRESAAQAIPIMTGWASLPPHVQAQLQPLYEQYLKGVGIEQSDTITAPLQPPPPPLPGPAGPDGQPLPPEAEAEAGMTEERAHDILLQLEQTRKFMEHPGYARFMAHIEHCKAEAVAGVAARDKTPEKRAEWIEALHLLDGILHFMPSEEARLKSMLQRLVRQSERHFNIKVMDAIE